MRWYLDRCESGRIPFPPTPALYQLYLTLLLKMDDEEELLLFVRSQCDMLREARQTARDAHELGDDVLPAPGSEEEAEDRSETGVTVVRLPLLDLKCVSG